MSTLAGLAACRGTAGRDTMRVRVLRDPKDSTVFTVAEVAHPCRGGGVLFDAVNGGNGALVWIRSPHVAPGAYPLLGRADSTTPLGALVAVRFIWHDIAHGFSVDSGTVALGTAGSWYQGRVQGSGTDIGLASKATVDIRIDSVQPRRDTIACGAKQ